MFSDSPSSYHESPMMNYQVSVEIGEGVKNKVSDREEQEHCLDDNVGEDQAGGVTGDAEEEADDGEEDQDHHEDHDVVEDQRHVEVVELEDQTVAEDAGIDRIEGMDSVISVNFLAHDDEC